MDTKQGLMTLDKTAQLLKTTKVNVLMHARKGLLEQVEDQGLWYITIDSLEEFIGNNGARKADNVCGSGCSRAASCGGGCG